VHFSTMQIEQVLLQMNMHEPKSETAVYCLFSITYDFGRTVVPISASGDVPVNGNLFLKSMPPPRESLAEQDASSANKPCRVETALGSGGRYIY
jgi:hypothetical protein